MNFQYLRSSLVSTLVLALAAGCGTSNYNALMEQRQIDLKRQAPFTKLSAPTDIPGTTVKLGIPAVLSRFATLDTPDATSPTGKISAERVKLSLLKLPGVYCVYDSEQPIADGAKVPVSCQIAIIPKSAPEAAGLGVMLDAGLKLAFPDKPVEWQDVQVDTPAGDAKVAWKMIHVDGDLLFDIYPADPNAPLRFEKLPAAVEVWWHEDPGNHYHTLLVWRAPYEVNETLNLMALAPLTAGTISVEPPAAPANAEAAPAPAAP